MPYFDAEGNKHQPIMIDGQFWDSEEQYEEFKRDHDDDDSMREITLRHKEDDDFSDDNEDGM